MPTENTSTLHKLKIDPGFTDLIRSGYVRCQIRRNDRDFKAGDRLALYETTHTGQEMKIDSPLEYTGRSTAATISHVFDFNEIPGLKKGFVALSIIPTSQTNIRSASK